jgi:hypothetical protein
MTRTIRLLTPCEGWRAVLGAALLLLLWTTPAPAKFQRMVIFPGSHTFAGKTGKLPAYCMDLSRPSPGRANTFQHVDGKVNFQKIGPNGRPLGPPVSLPQAIRDGEVRITGTRNEDIEFLHLEFPKLRPGERAKVDSEGFGVAAESQKDAEEGSGLLKPQFKLLADYEAQRAKVAQSLGADSDLARLLDQQKPEILWDVTGEQPVPADFADRMFDTVRGLIASPSDQQALERLTLLHGKELTPQQVEGVNQILGLKLDSNQPSYTGEFRASLRNYTEARAALAQATGKDHNLNRAFTRVVFAHVRDGKPLAQALEAAGRAVFAPRFRGRPELARDLLALMEGVHLTDAQAASLGQALGLKLAAREPRLRNHFVITTTHEGEIDLNSTRASETFPRAGLTGKLLREKLGASPQVVVHGPIDEVLAGQLNEAGVYVVRTEQDFLTDPLPKPVDKVRLVMVASKAKTAAGREANRTIYQAAGDIRSIERAAEMADAVGAVFVTDAKALEAAIKEAAARRERPVVFFHNAGGRMLFADGQELPLRAFDQAFGQYQAMAIGCSTFDAGGLPLRTLTDLYVIDFVRAFQASTAAPGAGSATPPHEFLNALGRNYAASLGKRKAVLVASSAGGLGGSALIAYLLANLLDDDDTKKGAGDTKDGGGRPAGADRGRRPPDGPPHSPAGPPTGRPAPAG